MTMYRPPFAPYSQRRESQDPDPALRHPWDGCWCWTLARAIDGATLGHLGGLDERTIRRACNKPDHSGVKDGATLEDQVRALCVIAPGLWFQARPTEAQLRAHLGQGGMAVMAGWENNAPATDRAYDRSFYDRVTRDSAGNQTGTNGHSNFCQGLADGSRIWWGNPEKPVDWAEPVVSIDAAVKFCWPGQHGARGRLEAILLRSVEVGIAVARGESDLYVPVTPFRFADSRSRLRLTGRLGPNQAQPLQFAGVAGIPANAIAIAGNMTIVKPAAKGFAVIDSDSRTPVTSRVNFPAGVDLANSFLVALGPDGKASLFATAECDVLIDVDGYHVSEA